MRGRYKKILLRGNKKKIQRNLKGEGPRKDPSPHKKKKRPK